MTNLETYLTHNTLLFRNKTVLKGWVPLLDTITQHGEYLNDLSDNTVLLEEHTSLRNMLEACHNPTSFNKMVSPMNNLY